MNTDESSKTNPPPQASAPPPFVERGGELVARPPFLQENTHLRCFFLEANRGKLKSVCDKVFNEPTRGALNFRPYSNVILLTFAKIDRIYSLYGNDAERGAMSEIDVAFWIPLLSEREGMLHLCWYNPYIFVDNPFAMSTGREVYGFPKTIAQFQIPGQMSSVDPYWVKTLAMERFQADSHSRPMRVLEVHRTRHVQHPTRQFATIQSLISILTGENENLSTRFSLGWQNLQKMIKTQEIQMVFLRQLRDIHHPTSAAYQEIIEAPFKVAHIHRGGVLSGVFEVRLPINASFPIAEELGLDAERNPVKAAYWMDFDFFLDIGQILWTTNPKPLLEI
jgi:hypothetical protein